jgi:hypothetical protein
VIGVEPGRLASASPVDRFSPRTLAGALVRAVSQNPAIGAAMFNVDVAAQQVKSRKALGQRRLDLDTARLFVQQYVTQSWGSWRRRGRRLTPPPRR